MMTASARILEIAEQLRPFPTYHDLAREMVKRAMTELSASFDGAQDVPPVETATSAASEIAGPKHAPAALPQQAEAPTAKARRRFADASYGQTAETLQAALAQHGTVKSAAATLGLRAIQFKAACDHLGVRRPTKSEAMKARVRKDPSHLVALRERARLARQARSERTEAKAPPASLAPESDEESWTNERRRELADLWLQEPFLSMTQIADRIGRTESAIQTAASRFNLPNRVVGRGTTAEALAAIRRDGKFRKCMTCPREFFSEHKGNRMCPKCLHGDDAVAA